MRKLNQIGLTCKDLTTKRSVWPVTEAYGVKPGADNPTPISVNANPSNNIKQAAPDNEAPLGSCPGDGVCNGAGGKSCCSGCPAYNNTLREPSVRAEATRRGLAAQASDSASLSPIPFSGPIDLPNLSPLDAGPITSMACENCGTRTTPLWRRDGEGRVACNVSSLSYLH